MTPLDTAAQIAGTLAALALFVKVEPVLNVMGRHCRASIRLAYWLLASGSAVALWWVMQGRPLPLPSVLTLIGAAALTLSDRRAALACGDPQNGR